MQIDHSEAAIDLADAAGKFEKLYRMACAAGVAEGEAKRLKLCAAHLSAAAHALSPLQGRPFGDSAYAP